MSTDIYVTKAKKSRRMELLALLGAVALAAAFLVFRIEQGRLTEQPPADPIAKIAEIPSEAPQVEDPIVISKGPQFDLVRVDKDGAAVIAGRATPGKEVRIIGNGVILGKSIARQDGSFVALLDMPTSGEAVALRLGTDNENGETDYSAKQFLVMARDTSTGKAPRIISAEGSVAEFVQIPEPSAEPAIAPQTDEVAASELPSLAKTAHPKIDLASAQNLPKQEEQPQIAGPAPEIERVAIAQAELAPQTQTASLNIQSEAQTIPVSLPAITSQSSEAETLPRASAAPETPAPLPRATTRLTLDTISYAQSGDVVLAGRGQADSAVRVYVDNQPVSLGAVKDGQWRLALPNVDEGIYTVRVDEVDESGAVTSRVESPFKREIPDPEAIGPEITIQPGYTLWELAELKYGSGDRYIQIFEANKGIIKNPDLIYPGQIFDLPE